MEKKEYTKNQIIFGLVWKLLERLGTQGVQFVIQIILARLLLPEEFGMIAIVTIFITLANVFVQSGFNTALIQKKEVDNTDLSSIFFVSLIVSGILYVILFFTAPYIANFYEEPQLKWVLRVLASTLFLGAVNSIQNSIVARGLQFKKLFLSSLGAIVIAGTIGIIMAYKGYGVWALVAYQLNNSFLITIIMNFTIKWRPSFIFSFKRVKQMFSYGWKLLVSSILNRFYIELRSLIIGKIYTTQMLGFYNRGNQFPTLIVDNINGSIQTVMLPTYSAYQEDKKRVKEIMRRAIVTSSFIIFPMMTGLAVVAKPMVTIILTEKWLPCVPFLQIACIIYALYPIHTANLQAINGMGRSDIFLKLEVIKKVLGISILIVMVFYGVYAIAWGGVVESIIAAFINAYPNRKLLDYSYKEQLKDIIPSLLLSIFMGGIVYSISFLMLGNWVTLLLQIVIGIIIYIVLAYFLKLECFSYLCNTLRELVKKTSIEKVEGSNI